MTTEYSSMRNNKNKKISLRNYFLYGGPCHITFKVQPSHAWVELSSFGHLVIVARTEAALEIKYHPSYAIINNLFVDITFNSYEAFTASLEYHRR